VHCGTEEGVWWLCGPALVVKAKAGMIHPIWGITGGCQVKLGDSLAVHAIPECYSDEVAS